MNKLGHIRFRFRACSIGIAILITGCGGGGGRDAGTAAGAFVDSPVEGLAYDAGAEAGRTDAAGRFEYAPGAVIRFSIGDIEIGQAVADAVLSPVDLVPGATDETDPTVTNITRFLLTLDADSDPSNGITIPPAVSADALGQSVDFDQSTDEFANDPSLAAVLAALGVGPLTPLALAQNHLQGSLLGLQAGRYTGSFAGDDSGSFRAYLDRRGNVLGHGSSQAGPMFLLAGLIASDGSGTFGSVTTGSSFDVGVDDGAVTGTWANASLGTSGTVGGAVVDPVEAVLDPATMQQVAGDYVGFYKVGGVVNSLSLTIAVDGSIAISVATISAVAAVHSTTTSEAVLGGMASDGSEIDGQVSTSGSLFGTWNNAYFAEAGTFAASRL